MNIVIFIVSALATLALCIVIVKCFGISLFVKSRAEDYISNVYTMIENEKNGYLYKKGDCPQDIKSQYKHLIGHCKFEYLYEDAKKLLHIGSSYSLDELNKKCNKLGKQYMPSPDYTDSKNIELLDELWKLFQAKYILWS